MAVSKVSSLNSLFAAMYEDAIFAAREFNLAAGLVTNYTATGMQTRYLGIYPSLTAQEVGEGVDYSNATEWTKTQQMSLTPKRVQTQVVLTDQRIATDPDDAQQDASREMGGAIATKIDVDLLALFSSLATGLGSAGSALTIAIIAAAQARLHNTMARAPFATLLHPYGWHDIWVELGQPATQRALLGDVANAALNDYNVGNWLAMNWYVSANIAVDVNADAVGAVFNREALALDTRQAPRMEVERDASLQGWEVNMTAWYAVGVRRSTYGVYITHDATAPTG